MTSNLGKSTADLTQPTTLPDQSLVELLNQTITPDKPLTADDIYIRSLFVTSTAVNAYGGRFSVDDLPHLCDLLIDSPVLIGHRKDSLPVARVFHAEIVTRDNAPWLHACFYWLKSVDGSATLRDNIDGGVYKECSLSFTYQHPECSICGKDIRLCRHEPFVEYPTARGRETCHFLYRQVEKVLETSLVYRGAVENTKVGSLSSVSTDAPLDLTSRPSLPDATLLADDCRYLVTPAYDGIPVTLTQSPQQLSMHSLSDDTLPDNLAAQFSATNISGLNGHFGVLVGYRGKERCSLDDLRKYLLCSSRPVTRLVVHLFPHPAIRLPLPPHPSSTHSIRPIPFRIAGAKELVTLAWRMRSTHGVDLWPLDQLPPFHLGWRFDPASGKHHRSPQYTLTRLPERNLALLTLDSTSERRRFLVHQFDPRGLLRGCRYIADPAGDDLLTLFSSDDASPAANVSRHTGDLSALAPRGEGFTFTSGGILRGSFVIRPVRLDGRTRFLFYRRRE